MALPETPRAAAQQRSHAFGLKVECEREIVGLPVGTGSHRGVATAIEIAAPGTRPESGGKEVRLARGPDGRVTLTVHCDDEQNYVLRLSGVGAYRVSCDGLLITCFPEAGVEDWCWQRAVVNQVLPLAATVRGLEVLHAGAVELGGRVVALVGHPGAGKSSTTLNLILRGATFFTDDALAIERSGVGLLAHPGAGVSNFPRSERALMDDGEPERLGSVLGGESNFKSLLAVERVERSLPLGGLYFLRRGADGTGTRFEPVTNAGASLLLGSTYVLSVRSPERLANQLDLCAAIARQTPIFDVHIPDAVSARESAGALMDHATAVLEGASR